MTTLDAVPPPRRLDAARANVLFDEHIGETRCRLDSFFGWLMVAQWVCALLIIALYSSDEWAVKLHSSFQHGYYALIFGGVLTIPTSLCALLRPGWVGTRHVVAAAQMLWSALLIHLTAGRIETHFHIFASLALLAYYRDWRVLLTATLTIACEHLVRGLAWPESLYGVANPPWWRFFEHMFWVSLVDVVLLIGIIATRHEVFRLAARRAQVEDVQAGIEREGAARARELAERRASELELQQAQKLESVGRLASGIAHEINTPIQFVGDSVHFVREAVQDLFGLIEKLQLVRSAVEHGEPADAAAAVANAAEQSADLAYLCDNVPKALDRSLDGLSRVATIVRSMKEFAHPDQKEMAEADVNQAISSTLVIARNEFKYVADLETELGAIPPVNCHIGDINQAVLNIVINAAHAIEGSVAGSERRGRISVRTRAEGDSVVITIADTGGGIPEAVRERIFDPFFTTKEVGKGTGQGLAIARSVVVDKHGGELSFESELGRGTTFTIRLPIAGRAKAPVVEAA